MIQQIDYEKWLDRLDGVIALQKDLQEQTMTMRLSRRELIELRLMASRLHGHCIKSGKRLMNDKGIQIKNFHLSRQSHIKRDICIIGQSPRGI